MFLGVALNTSSLRGAVRYRATDLTALELGGNTLNNVGGMAGVSRSFTDWVYWDGSEKHLYPLPLGLDAAPLKINDSGQMVGNWSGDSGQSGAIFWDGERFIDLTALVNMAPD